MALFYVIFILFILVPALCVPLFVCCYCYFVLFSPRVCLLSDYAFEKGKGGRELEDILYFVCGIGI